jgi:hypothetical protein
LKVPDRKLTLIALANVDTVNRMYRLVEGDVLRQALAVEFYGRFVAENVPVIDWTADRDAIASRLEKVNAPAVRDVLELELAAYRMTFVGLNDGDTADRLGTLLRDEFGWPPLLPAVPQASTDARGWSWVVFWALAIWGLLVVGSMIDVGRRLRRDRSGWPARVVWPAAALVLGPVGAIAHRMSTGPGGPRLALAAGAVAVLAPLAATAGAVAWFGELDLRPVVFGLLLGLLLVRAPLRAGSIRSYPRSLARSLPWELVSTLSVFSGILLAMVPLVNAYGSLFGLEPSPGSLVFWGMSSAAGIAGVITTWPVQFWMVRRRRAAVPGIRIENPVKVRMSEMVALGIGSLGVLAVGLLVVGAF